MASQLCMMKSGVAGFVFKPMKSLNKGTENCEMFDDWRLVLWLMNCSILDASLSTRLSQKSSDSTNCVQVGSQMFTDKHKEHWTCSEQEIWMMASVFWEGNYIILFDFTESGSTITVDVYCETLTRLRHAIHDRRRSKLSSGVILLHNLRSHIAGLTKKKILNFFTILQ